MRKTKRFVLGCGALTLLASGALSSSPATAGTYKLIYSFCAAQNCADGANAGGPLVLADSRHLYGVTGRGGNGFGTVFKMTQTKAGWAESVLYKFCSGGSGNCTDGSNPNGLIMDRHGDLFGTTVNGGLAGRDAGTIFELVNAGHGQWTFQTLYSFCASGNPCPDGWLPNGLSYAGAASGLRYDGKSPLYGTTMSGGNNQLGAVFELTRKRGVWSERAIYSFCSKKKCSDGYAPYATVAVSPSGTLYGTTAAGGQYTTGGAVYELAPVTKKRWTETVLYSFCSLAGCPDGQAPEDTPLLDSNNNIYGTTSYGGTRCENSGYPCGVAFELSSEGTESTVHPFCTAKTCADGTNPSAGLISDASGELFGTTQYGGQYGSDSEGGTIFELSSGGSFQVLYNFCTDQLLCTDGSRPGHLVMDASGTMYGSTVTGGANGSGAVFEITP